MSVPRPPGRRPPPPKHEQQHQARVQFNDTNANTNTAKEPQSKTESILRLIPDPNHQRAQPIGSKKHTPPAREFREPAPADIENWLEASHHWEHTPTTSSHVAAAKAITSLHLQQRHVAQHQAPQPGHAPGTISSAALDPSSSTSLNSSPLASSPFQSSPPRNDGSNSENPPQPRPLCAQLVKLQNAVQSSREAETLHAYDVGVIAALRSMLLYWNGRADAMQTSSAERGIFLREAQRLTELMDGAERGMLISNAELVKKQEREEGLWEGVLADDQFVNVSLAPPSGVDANSTARSWEVVKGESNSGHSAGPVLEEVDSNDTEDHSDVSEWDEQGQAAASVEENESEPARAGPCKPSGFPEDGELIDDENEVMPDFEDVNGSESQGSLGIPCSWPDEQDTYPASLTVDI